MADAEEHTKTIFEVGDIVSETLDGNRGLYKKKFL
jgi:hypothetical protein